MSGNGVGIGTAPIQAFLKALNIIISALCAAAHGKIPQTIAVFPIAAGILLILRILSLAFVSFAGKDFKKATLANRHYLAMNKKWNADDAKILSH